MMSGGGNHRYNFITLWMVIKLLTVHNVYTLKVMKGLKRKHER